jgi:cell division protein FtsX
MMSKKTLLWVVAVIVALTGGFVSGVWAGAKTEQDTLVDLLARADLTTDCQSQIDQAVRDTISDWEGGPPPSP